MARLWTLLQQSSLYNSSYIMMSSLIKLFSNKITCHVITNHIFALGSLLNLASTRSQKQQSFVALQMLAFLFPPPPSPENNDKFKVVEKIGRQQFVARLCKFTLQFSCKNANYYHLLIICAESFLTLW